MVKRSCALWALLWSLVVSQNSWGVELRIAAASDLQYALNELARIYEKSHPDMTVKISYGSSGSLAAQIAQRAPYDLFLAADPIYSKTLNEQGRLDDASEFHYATGRIVVWMPRSFEVNLASEGMKTLLNPKILKIAIANPQHAPYGRAAVAALRSAGIYEQVKSKLVYGENVAQAAQFVETGAAQAGIIALSLAQSERMEKQGKAWKIPSDLYSPIQQMGWTLRDSKNRKSAQEFRECLTGKAGRDVLRKFGYSVN